MYLQFTLFNYIFLNTNYYISKYLFYLMTSLSKQKTFITLKSETWILYVSVNCITLFDFNYIVSKIKLLYLANEYYLYILYIM